MEKDQRKCADCCHIEAAITTVEGAVLRHRCSVPFDLSNAPVVVARHLIKLPGSSAPECPHWKAK